MLRSLRRYSTSPVVSVIGGLVKTSVSLFIALVLVMFASSVLGGVSVFGHHIPQPIVLLTVCS